MLIILRVFCFSSRRRHTRFDCDWSSDVCSSDLGRDADPRLVDLEGRRLDADHDPPVAERGPQFLLADPARPPGPRLTVAEADQVAAAEIGRASCRERV